MLGAKGEPVIEVVPQKMSLPNVESWYVVELLSGDIEDGHDDLEVVRGQGRDPGVNVIKLSFFVTVGDPK